MNLFAELSDIIDVFDVDRRMDLVSVAISADRLFLGELELMISRSLRGKFNEEDQKGSDMNLSHLLYETLYIKIVEAKKILPEF